MLQFRYVSIIWDFNVAGTLQLFLTVLNLSMHRGQRTFFLLAPSLCLTSGTSALNNLGSNSSSDHQSTLMAQQWPTAQCNDSLSQPNRTLFLNQWGNWELSGAWRYDFAQNTKVWSRQWPHKVRKSVNLVLVCLTVAFSISCCPQESYSWHSISQAWCALLSPAKDLLKQRPS